MRLVRVPPQNRVSRSFRSHQHRACCQCGIAVIIGYLWVVCWQPTYPQYLSEYTGTRRFHCAGWQDVPLPYCIVGNDLRHLETIQLTGKGTGHRGVVQIDDTHRQTRRQALVQHRGKEEDHQYGEQHYTEAGRYDSGAESATPGSMISYICLRYLQFSFNLFNSFNYLIISDIPGRKPSISSTGRAFTSNVFRSYCPFVLVAFHTANEPWSFI